jgi:hypothetical protein
MNVEKVCFAGLKGLSMRITFSFLIILVLIPVRASHSTSDECRTALSNELQNAINVVYPKLNEAIIREHQTEFWDINITTITPIHQCVLHLKTQDLNGLPDVWVSATFPAWSPSGDSLAFIGEEIVLDVSADHQTDVWQGWRGPRDNPFLYYFSGNFAYDVGLDYSADVYTGPVVWSDDGFIAVAYRRLNAEQWEPVIEIRNEKKYPTHFIASANMPTWSPTEQTVVISMVHDGLSNLKLFKFPDAESENVDLTTGRGRNVNPTWTPDGETIGFASNREGTFDIFSIAPDGTGLRRLTFDDATHENYPNWSPDGNWLTYLQSDVDASQLTYNFMFREWPDGDTYRVTPPNEIWPHYKWLPDNTGVIFYMGVDDDVYALHWLDLACITSGSGCEASDFNRIPNTEISQYLGFDVTDNMNLRFGSQPEQ